MGNLQIGANRYDLTHEHVNLADDVVSELYSDDFHVWTVEWGPTGFNYYLDDDEDPYMTVNSTEFGGYWSYGEFDTNQPNSFNPWSGTVGDASQGGLDAPFDQVELRLVGVFRKLFVLIFFIAHA